MAIPKLALIPSGYKDGKVYSVLPSNGDGDFTFSRGSNATRVNKDGLIETMPLELGSELLTNGSFDTDSDWVKGSEWSISGGLASCDGTQSGLSYLDQSGAIASGKVYKATYEITSISAGELRIFVGSVSGIPKTSTGVYTEYITTSSSNFWLRGSSDFTGSIDNVSVKEVTSGFDLPRLDYTDSSCPSLLLEPQSTNLVTYSEDFSDSSWVKNGVSATSGFISPDGSSNAYKLVEDTSTGNHRLKVTLSPIGTTTTSIYAKADSLSKIMIFSGSVGYGFDLLSGGVSSVANLTAPDSFNITELTNGWYNCSITHSSAGNFEVYALRDFTSYSYNGDGTSGVYVWGAQLEQQSYATSYIPTNGAVATRLADVCTSAGNASTFNDSEGVLYAEISALADDGTSRQISLSSGSSATNKVSLIYTATSNQVQAFIRSSGSIAFNVSETLSDTTNNNKIALKYKQNDFALWVNGIKLAIDTSGNAPTGLNVLDFNDADGANDFYGKTKQVQYFDTTLTDIELEELTSWSSFILMAKELNYKIK